MCLLTSYMSDARDEVDLPVPAILKPMELWTGKQLFSLLVRPNARTRWVVWFDSRIIRDTVQQQRLTSH